MSQAPGAAAEANGNAGEDFTQLGPRPENLMPRTGDKAAAAADGAADGIYRPPKLNPAAMQVTPAPKPECMAPTLPHSCTRLGRWLRGVPLLISLRW